MFFLFLNVWRGRAQDPVHHDSVDATAHLPDAVRRSKVSRYLPSRTMYLQFYLRPQNWPKSAHEDISHTIRFQPHLPSSSQHRSESGHRQPHALTAPTPSLPLAQPDVVSSPALALTRFRRGAQLFCQRPPTTTTKPTQLSSGATAQTKQKSLSCLVQARNACFIGPLVTQPVNS
ncbi:hypothetical protein LZ30DRAFT_699036 [Colletotrichum cereale]|nr:hypothetical protein LZ30DRAFT_699036 [Colletotrichum cereale]